MISFSIPVEKVETLIQNSLDNIMILGQIVPKFPNLEENNSNLFGVDSDGNGIRDDIDRSLATDRLLFKANPVYDFATLLQLILKGEAVEKYADLVFCGENYPTVGSVFQIYKSKILNTPERIAFYQDIWNTQIKNAVEGKKSEQNSLIEMIGKTIDSCDPSFKRFKGIRN